MATYLIRCAETGREQQARLGKQRHDLASVILARWPDVTVAVAPGRLVVDGPPDLAEALATVPGLLDVAPCERAARADLTAAAVAVARRCLSGGRTFAVRVKRDRRDDLDGPRSLEIAKAVASTIVEATSAGVDLTAPDVTIHVELRGDVAYIYDRVVPGIDRAGPHESPAARAASGEPTFVADQMLGRLAARLRLLGYDTLTVFDIADSEVTRRAAEDGRILLTRDGPLSRTLAVPVHYVVATQPQAQLAEVLRVLGVTPDPAKLFTRCTLCNAQIEPVERTVVATRLPPDVRDSDVPVYRCPGCDQVYWRGSHVDRILADLAISGVKG